MELKDNKELIEKVNINDLINKIEKDPLPTNIFTTEDTDPLVLLGKLNEVIANLKALRDIITESEGTRVYDNHGNLLANAKFTGHNYINVDMDETDPETFDIRLDNSITSAIEDNHTQGQNNKASIESLETRTLTNELTINNINEKDLLQDNEIATKVPKEYIGYGGDTIVKIPFGDDRGFAVRIYDNLNDLIGVITNLKSGVNITNKGGIRFISNLDSSSQGTLLMENGGMSFNNHVVELLLDGNSNYFKYESGLLICWGSMLAPTGYVEPLISLPHPYYNTSYLALCQFTYNGELSYTCGARPYTTTQIKIKKNGQSSKTIAWITIGYWK